MRATIDLSLEHEAEECKALAADEYATLNKPTYSVGASIMRVRSSTEEHLAEHRTFRKRVLRAERKGYTVEKIDPAEWHGDILAINNSAPVRQGRPMSKSYTDYQQASKATVWPCPLHNVTSYGVVTDDGTLVGYATMYRCGELLHVSQFLGHEEFLDDGIMYKLVADILRRHEDREGVMFYNRHDSGTDGLRWFKERLGLQMGDITWIA